MRIVIAEDAALLREGLAGLLTDRGHEVVGRCGDADTLLSLVVEHEPDVVVTDIRMPPGYSDEGARAAVHIRRHHPRIGILVLSQHVETQFAVELVSSSEGFGYLLKDRVLEVDQFLDALARVAAGGSVLDPTVVSALLRRATVANPLDVLTDRERTVLELMAEGRSNAAIAGQLWLGERTVESHIGSIFSKLGLPGSAQDHRRVRAVVTYLNAMRVGNG
ncbi:DNA-binding response regulator [Acrocarpospora phusangensis]|uniref:DNA-binding response regulator n=1 Tax=Acrocarpospora phusangensis TaxID=1070424 RepID=A0A919UMG8_9ACTN|nr:response regulator transcription factor [Acrocarpospora phusangensis]GIH23327.1 DNA-binding response regulator [Acrocarpospora phusangensis]